MIAKIEMPSHRAGSFLIEAQSALQKSQVSLAGKVRSCYFTSHTIILKSKLTTVVLLPHKNGKLSFNALSERETIPFSFLISPLAV